MPLTIAHPAVVIPIYRRMKKYSVLSALIIGSMAPDFTYFLFLPIDREQTHSILGILWFCLPIGLLTFIMFHKIMKQPFFSLFPEPFAVHFSPALVVDKRNPFLDFKNFLVVSLSIIIGALTHIVWDSFTHEYGFMVLFIPFLQTKLFDLFGYEVYVFKILQHGSSVIGTTLLAYWIFRWYQESNYEYSNMKNLVLPFKFRILFFGCVFFIASFFGFFIGYYYPHHETGVYAFREFLHGFILSAVAITCALFLVYSFSYHFMQVLKDKWENL